MLLRLRPSVIILGAEMRGAEEEGGWEKCWVVEMRSGVGNSGLWLHLLLQIQILKEPQISMWFSRNDLDPPASVPKSRKIRASEKIDSRVRIWASGLPLWVCFLTS